MKLKDKWEIKIDVKDEISYKVWNVPWCIVNVWNSGYQNYQLECDTVNKMTREKHRKIYCCIPEQTKRNTFVVIAVSCTAGLGVNTTFWNILDKLYKNVRELSLESWNIIFHTHWYSEYLISVFSQETTLWRRMVIVGMSTFDVVLIHNIKTTGTIPWQFGILHFYHIVHQLLKPMYYLTFVMGFTSNINFRKQKISP